MTVDYTPWPEQTAQRYRELGVWSGHTLSDALATSVTQHGPKIALIDARQRLSYDELARRVAALARGFLSLELHSGDSVIVQLPNCTELLEVCFALWAIGVRPIMALPAHREREIGHFAEQTGAAAHVVAKHLSGFDYTKLSANVRTRCPSLKHTLVVGGTEPDTALSTLYLDSQERALPRVEASAVALFQLSGGSTNLPKLIPRTHNDYLYSVLQSNEVCKLSSDVVYLAALPAAHNFPLSSPGTLGALLAGGTVVMAESAAPDYAFSLIEREQVTMTGLVPALLSAWLSHAAKEHKIRSLRVLQVGGAKLHEATARRVAPELGCTLQQVFGMAEGLVCYTRLDDPAELVVRCQGRPMSPHDELCVVDDEELPVPVGEVGNLLTRGPYTIRGYFRAIEHNHKVFTRDGFYRTGDRVRLLPEGNLVVEGRSKEQINRGGEKVAAPEIEEILCTHPQVAAAAVVAMPDRYLGERVCAFVTLRSLVRANELRAHLKSAGLATYKIPDRFEVVAALPATAVGKVDKKTLENMASALAEAQSGSVAPR